jgi:hypothetical protein
MTCTLECTADKETSIQYELYFYQELHVTNLKWNKIYCFFGDNTSNNVSNLYSTGSKIMQHVVRIA